MRGKWIRNGEKIYRDARLNGWKLITRLHDGIMMPENWERKMEGKDWEFKDAYDGSGGLISPDGKKIIRLW